MQTLFIVIAVILLAALLLWFVFPGTTTSLIINSGIRVLGFSQHRAQIGDTKFRWLETSTKGPPLVMVHGLTGDATNWIMMAPQLRAYRLIIPDIPPFGESRYNADGEADFSLHTQAERLDALLVHLGVDKFYLAGNSMGGYISGDYASNHPDKILGLLLLSPGAVKSVSFASHFDADLKAGRNPLRVENTQELQRLMELCFTKQPFVPEPIKRTILKRLLRISNQCNIIFDDMLNKNPGIEVLLADSPIPTLIYWGKEDKILNPKGGPALQKVMQNAELIMPEKTGHVPMLEYPKVTGEAMAAFINAQEVKIHSEPSKCS
ncbi:MAG: alpha/beta hydrolase [Xanthomonadales bacterium]|nr:alpha/beta hydrolase [Xanthomonadales bacterium]